MPRAARVQPPVEATVAPPTVPVDEHPHSAGAIVVDPSAIWVPIDTVRKWDSNPRINREAIPKVAASIRRFGFIAPAVVWREKGQLVAGHTRMAALEAILASDPTFVPRGAPANVRPGMMPIREHDFASADEAAAYAIADNRLGEAALWDEAKLTEVLTGIDAALIAVSGFDPAQFSLPDLAVTLPEATLPEATLPAPSDGSAAGTASTTAIVVGDIRIPVSADLFAAWKSALIDAVGMSRKDQFAEVRRRLGL